MIKKFYTFIATFKYLSLLLLLAFPGGCQKDDINSPQFNGFTSDFDSVWTKFAINYPLFEYKNINWESVLQQYRDQFKLISIEERNNKLAEIFSIFKDAHIYLKTPDGRTIGQYVPGNFSINYNYQYLSNFQDSIGWHFESEFWGWGIINNTGYIRFTDLHTGSVDINAFDKALNNLRMTDGIIIDIRELHGGNLNLCEDIWNRFINEPLIVGYQLFRNGAGYNDYAPLTPVITNPKGEWNYLKKIVLLIGQLSFSVGEIFAETMSHFQNVTLIGDTTFGGVEAPLGYLLSDGTEYSVPIVAYLNSEKEPLEWKGVIPDIYFDPSEIRFNNQKDLMIEEAFKIIKVN